MKQEKEVLRICLLADSFYPVIGGGEAHARLLSEKLIALGTNVFVLTQRRIKGLKKNEMVGKIPVIRVRPSGWRRFGKYFMQVPAFLYLLKHRSEFDVSFVCGIRALGPIAVIASKIIGKQCILRAESCDEVKSAHIINSVGILKTFIKPIISLRNKLLSHADGFIAISKAIRQEYMECEIPLDKIKDLPNGIDTEIYYPGDLKGKKNLRESLNLPDKIVFSYTGKLNRGKGLEMLLRAWKTIVAEYENTLLVLVGSGGNQFLSCEKELRAYSTREGIQDRIIFTGYVENVADYLRASDYFILPSESEAHPLSLLEALACGIPSVATKAGGITDIIEDKKNARLVNINDEAALRDVIISFLENPEMTVSFRKAGLATIRLRYDINFVASQYLDYFKKILS